MTWRRRAARPLARRVGAGRGPWPARCPRPTRRSSVVRHPVRGEQLPPQLPDSEVHHRGHPLPGPRAYPHGLLVRGGHHDGGVGGGLRPAPQPVRARRAPERGAGPGTSQRRALFVCTGNSRRSPTTGGLLRYRAEARVEAASAGIQPKPLHPAGRCSSLASAYQPQPTSSHFRSRPDLRPWHRRPRAGNYGECRDHDAV